MAMMVLIFGMGNVVESDLGLIEEDNTQQTIQVKNDSRSIDIVVRHEGINTDFSLKDYAPIIIAAFAMLSFVLNLRILNISSKDRKLDKENEKFVFWIKDIIFPQYINPILSEIRCLGDLYGEVLETQCPVQQETFLDYWGIHKREIKTKIYFGIKLPYTSNVFLSMNEKINEIEDIICLTFYGEEVMKVGEEATDDSSITNEAPPHSNPFVELHDTIISLIHDAQKHI
jgi:hypothetical protein